MDKVCIDCINANKHLKISSDFKVSVEYGACDCCGKHYIVIPFRRFFSENIKLTPCTEFEKKEATSIDEKEGGKRKNAVVIGGKAKKEEPTGIGEKVTHIDSSSMYE